MSFSRPQVKVPCTITILEGSPTTINATYNPKEVTIDKAVPWQKHEKSKGDLVHVEFTAAEPKKLSVELFFDTYEDGTNVHEKFIKRLERATLIMSGGKEEDRRPPTCILTWGGGFPKFEGVMESLSVKYTMFFADGTPCRATASVKLMQAGKVSAKAERQEAGGGGGGGDGAAGGGGGGASSTPGSDGSDPRGR